MIIVSQDRDTAINFENVEIIGIGDPLEDNNGKFKILCNTTSDNQYTIAKYESAERAKEVLAEIANIRAIIEIYKCSNDDTQDIFDKKNVKRKSYI